MEKTLLCVEIPGGSVFPVVIEPNQQVWELKVMIKEEKSATIKCNAAQLDLYIAKKNGVWLKSKDADVKDLKKGVVSDDIHALMDDSLEMDPTETIEMFDFPDATTAGNIHVLVRVPAVNNDVNDQRVQPSAEGIKHTVMEAINERKRKRSVYSISSLHSAQLEAMRRKINVEQYLIDPEEEDNESIEKYSWIPNISEDDPLQKSASFNYIKDNLDSLLKTGCYQLEDVTKDEYLLALSDPRLPFRVKGTTDLVLAKRREKKPPSMLFGLCLVINLKKEITNECFCQAMAQLICASIKAPLFSYPVSLLTDLKNHWYFFWFKEDDDKRYLVSMRLKHPKNAFDLIEKIALAEQDEALKIPFTKESFKKFKVDDFMEMPADAFDELMERYELMSDVLEPEFLMERRREYLLHQFARNPMFSHLFE